MSLIPQLDYFCNLFIRPSRQKYLHYDLGPELRNVEGRKVRRLDFSISNRKSQNIKASLFSCPEKTCSAPSTCLIYLHCNSGSRVEGIPCLNTAVSLEMTLLVFDFAGSGMSDGEFVSLGYNETEDLEDLIGYCKQKNYFQDFILWGRSMGAVTALSYGSKKIEGLKGIIADSAFSSLSKLALDFGSSSTSLPKFLLSPGLIWLGKVIKSKIGINLFDINICDYAKAGKSPILFITSHNDKLVRSYHSEELYNSYGGGQKQLYFIDSDHNDCRKPICINRIRQFMLDILSINDKPHVIQNHISKSANTTLNADNIPKNPLINLNCKGLLNKNKRTNMNVDYSMSSEFISKSFASLPRKENDETKRTSPISGIHSRKPSAFSNSTDFSKIAIQQLQNPKNFNQSENSHRIRSGTYQSIKQNTNVSKMIQQKNEQKPRIGIEEMKSAILRNDLNNKPFYTIYR